ncbi:Pentatricopeptide repeat-containing protein [Thalictrum thalictroides]|uniref:Pentatricopeptide repeat-containing protein n=1 Tax=Thalictrum thalictroides TaxID=46969 RepID=A0A7J6WBY8_THATH|nr:Pentatricopeptide repeat-containing protein [Thalictrum thalictroides]
MEVYGHCGYLNESETLFVEIKQKNWVPDEPAYGLLVDLWGKAGNVDKAQSWFQAMLDAGLRPNVPTCNSLLRAFVRVHWFADAYNVLQTAGPDGQNVRDHASNFLDLMHSEVRESKRGLVDAVVDFLHKTGWGRRSWVTGSSLVRQSVEELLYVFGFPFLAEMATQGVLWDAERHPIDGCSNLMWKGCT